MDHPPHAARPRKALFVRAALNARDMWRVARIGEQIFMGSAPFLILFIVIQGRLGVPLVIRGYEFFALCIYMGAWFVKLVLLDRRAQEERRQTNMFEFAQKKQDRLNQRANRQAARGNAPGRRRRKEGASDTDLID